MKDSGEKNSCLRKQYRGSTTERPDRGESLKNDTYIEDSRERE